MTSLPAAVLWDLDGTLIDTEPYWIECEYELVGEYGGQWSDSDAHSIVGFDLIEAAKVIRERGSVPLGPQEIVDRLVTGVVARIRQHMPWRPGARELLTSLNQAGVPCALVTMSWRTITDEVLRQIPPGTFQTVITGDSVLNGKPHPEPYRRAAADLGVDPLSCVAIEDSPTGVASAEAAGCVVVAVPNVVPVAPARHRVMLQTLAGVTPEDLGEFIETTPPPPGAGPEAPPARSRPRPPITRSEQRRWAAGGLLAGRRRLLGAALVVVLLLAGIGVWFLTSRDGEKSYEPGPFNVQAWAFPSAAEQLNAELPVRANLFHQVSPFWFETTGATSIGYVDRVDQAQAQAFVDKAQELGVPVIASILDHNGEGGMAAILADPATRKAHIDTIVAFAASNDFDGVDIDYENFAFSDDQSTWEATRPNWVTFIRELSERLRADGRILTVSIPPMITEDFAVDGDRNYWVYDYGSIAQYVDAIRIMAYDKSNEDTAPGPFAPIDWVNRIVDSAVDEIGSPEKLVLGIPLYGYNWVTGKEGECPDDAEGNISQLRSRIAVLLAERNPTPPQFDPVSAETTFTYELVQDDGTTSCTQTRQVRYIDNQGLRERMQLTVDRGMRGIALFAFGYEDPTIWAEIEAMNATLATTTPADGAAVTTVAPATAAPTVGAVTTTVP